MVNDIDCLPARMQNASLQESAFEDFAREFGPRLRGLFCSRGLSDADAESLAVSCISDIALKVNRFTSQGPGSFERWVFKLAGRALIDAWRARDPAHPLEDLEDWEPVAEPREDAAPDVFEAVARGLAQLPETDQEIIRLRYLAEELPFGEIAGRLGLQEGTVRVRHHRAMPRLFELLAGQPEVKEWLARRGAGPEYQSGAIP